MVTVLTRQLGCSRPLLEDWSITFPPAWGGGDDPLTLRRLLERLVRAEVARWRERRTQRTLLHVLTPGELSEGRRHGRFVSGGQPLGPDVDEENAIGAALQAFADGLYLVIIDEQPQRELDGQVFLTPESTITLLRLVALSGG